MDKETKKEPQRTCFVVMGFGKKTDFETGRVLDLDKSYKNMIKPAVEAAGLKCIRGDEIVHSGLIDVPMYDQLLNADVVVADLSTSNKNAFYELGIRHALRPFTTIIIAEDGFKIFPFDVNHIAIRKYHHLGEDIGFDEVMSFRGQLTLAITTILNNDPRSIDSPVYTFLSELTPPALARVKAKVEEVASAANHNNSSDPDLPAASETLSILMSQVDTAQNKGDWITARTLLSLVRQTINAAVKKKNEQVDGIKEQEDPYILQRLALITYKSKFPTEKEALEEAGQLLTLLNPNTSNDPETLGLWGAIHKRLWELYKEANILDEAIRAYERGFYIRNDHYNGINYAFLLNIRANQANDKAEAIADFVEARRIRKEVLLICEQWLTNNPEPPGKENSSDRLRGYHYHANWYWVKATMSEAYVGLGDEENGQKILNEAYEKAPEGWMKESTEAQLSKLRPMLENSPLRHIKTD